MTTHRNVTAGSKRRRFGRLGEIYDELKKVNWLSRRDALYLTGAVLLVTIVATIVLGALDYGFARLVADVLLRK